MPSVPATPTRGGQSGPGNGMARGGAVNLAATICQQVALFLILALLAQALGPRSVGRYAECFALLSLLNLLSLAGFRSGLTRFIAMHLADADPGRVRGTVRIGLGLTIGGSAAIGVGLFLLAPFVADLLNDDDLVTGVRLVAVALPATAFTEAALAATQGWRSQRAFALIGRIFEPVGRLVATGFAVLVLGAGFTGAMVSIAAVAWVTALLAAVALHRRLRGVPRAGAVYEVREILGFSMVSWGSALAATGLIWADTLILGALGTTEDVGVYNVATRLVTLAVFVMPPITASFAPHMAHLYHVGEHDGAALAYGDATRWILMLSMPAFLMLIIFPTDLLHVFGSDFSAGAPATIILACGQLVAAAVGPCGIVLNMSGRVALSMADNVAVLVFNVALNFILIPRFGLLGAAVAWSASLIVVNLVKVWQARRVVGISARGAGGLTIAVAAIPAAAVGVAVQLLVDAWWASVLIGGVLVLGVYVAALLRLGLNPTDRTMLTAVLRRAGRQRARA